MYGRFWPSFLDLDTAAPFAGLKQHHLQDSSSTDQTTDAPRFERSNTESETQAIPQQLSFVHPVRWPDCPGSVSTGKSDAPDKSRGIGFQPVKNTEETTG